jgi:hypothetical protein
MHFDAMGSHWARGFEPQSSSANQKLLSHEISVTLAALALKLGREVWKAVVDGLAVRLPGVDLQEALSVLKSQQRESSIGLRALRSPTFFRVGHALGVDLATYV